MKTDFRKELGRLYRPSSKGVEEVEVAEMGFLMIDGEGSPGESEGFSSAVETLFPVAYALKFMVKKLEAGVDYTVMPLEGLWWADDMDDYISGNRSRWKWTLMIMQPDPISVGMVEEAVAAVAKRKAPPALARLRFERFREGRAAQILHVGPFAEEGPAVRALHDFVAASGGRLTGRHHEIYLSDFRRTPPPRLRTVIRQPFAPQP